MQTTCEASAGTLNQKLLKFYWQDEPFSHGYRQFAQELQVPRCFVKRSDRHRSAPTFSAPLSTPGEAQVNKIRL